MQTNSAFLTYEAIYCYISRGLLFGPPCIITTTDLFVQLSYEMFSSQKMSQNAENIPLLPATVLTGFHSVPILTLCRGYM